MIKSSDLLDIEKTVAAMTVEEKSRLVGGGTFFGSCAVERLGIPKMQLLDGGTGMNFEQLFGDMLDDYDLESTNGMVGSNSLVRVIEYFFEPERLHEEDIPLYNVINSRLCKLVEENLKNSDEISNDKDTKEAINNDTKESTVNSKHKLRYSPGCYPPGILLGSTWNPEAVYKVGQALGIDSVIFGVDFLLGSPNVNIHRDPLNGRLFEGYSEDPYLVSALAPWLVKGVQEYGVVANVKHFAANNQETYRTGIDEHISKRALEEIYFPGFKACVTCGVKSVMSAYNKINGVPCTESYDMLTGKLRDEWGFEDMVVSDWGAIKDAVAAIKAGNDLAMPGPFDYKPILEAVENGSLDMAVLDRAVERILRIINWVAANKKKLNLTVEEATGITDWAAYFAAAEGIVLLENNGVLPLRDDMNISIMGSPSFDNCGAVKSVDTLIECGNGSAGINTDRFGYISESISKHVSEGNVVVGNVCMDTDIILYFVKIPGMEGNDKKSLKMSDYDIQTINSLCSKKEGFGKPKRLVLILNTSGPVEFTGIDEDKIDALLAIFLPGMGGTHALADILYGKLSPSGRLPVTFPVRYEDTPTYINFPGDGYNVNYGEGIFVGYRYYDKKNIVPKYHFGYGLSYTTFECKLDGAGVCGNNIHIDISVRNTGHMRGSEVVQIYVGDVYSTIQKPVKELKEFKKVCLDAGEEKKLSFDIDVQRLASFDTDYDKWIVEEGWYDVYAATSAADSDVFGKERLYIDVKSEYSYGINSTIKTLYEHEKLHKALYELWNSYGFEEGILNSNYQYTASNKLADIIPLDSESSLKEFENKFMDSIKNIKKQ